jgi:acrylyl-CoA reductase (NADPH)
MRAFVVSEENGILAMGVRDVEPQPTADGDILVHVDYSAVNFKDAMVAAAKSRVRRLASLVGGARVAVHGGNLGVGRDGGFAEFVYSPAKYLSVLPESISTHDAMVIGTAGFTAMESVLALQDRGLILEAEVLVTGATGGVGSQAVTYLAAMGYRPVASTGSPQEFAWLLERGAVRVIGRDDVSDQPGRVMGSELWDGAIDCVGGETLVQIPRSLRYGAALE